MWFRDVGQGLAIGKILCGLWIVWGPNRQAPLARALSTLCAQAIPDLFGANPFDYTSKQPVFIGKTRCGRQWPRLLFQLRSTCSRKLTSWFMSASESRSLATWRQAWRTVV